MALISTEKTITEIRMPPQNLEAEISTLGSLMLDREVIYRVADSLLPRDFYRPAHAVIYEAMLDLSSKKEPIDVLSVTNRLREKEKLEEIGGSAYLTTLVNSVPTASHIEHYASIIKRKRLLRDLIDASHYIAQLGYKEADDVEMLLDDAEQKIFGISKDSTRQEFFAVREALEEAWDRIDRLHKGDGALRGVSTGFSDLDNILAGLQKSDLVVLAARPSLGKTSLALNIARNVALDEKKAVGIFSLEMSREQLIDRLIATEAGVDLWRIRTGKMRGDGPDNDFVRVRDAMQNLSDAPIYIDDSPSPNVMELRAKARRLQAQHDVGLIVIDYLQLIRGRDNIESRVQEVSEISRALKGLAKELNVPVLAVSQLSRGVEMRHPAIPKLSDLRESGCLAGDTLITRADTGERIPIKDLVGKSGIPVFSLNGNWQIETKEISKVFSSGQKTLYELTTRSGFKIKASANHPFLRVNGWTRLNELKTGDRIATPSEIRLSSPKDEMSEEEIILLAHLLGDGCILPKQPYHYTSADTQNIKIVTEVAKKLFDINAKIVKQKNWWHVYLTSPYRLTHRKYHPITNWFHKLDIKRVHSWEKEIPQAVFSLNNEKLTLFLRHIWATDGHVGIRQYRRDGELIKTFAGTLYYASTSFKMAEGIKHLLLRFGIRSKIHPTRKGNYRICYQIVIDGAKHQLTFFNQIGCFGERGKNIPLIVNKLSRIKTNTNLDVWPKETWKFIIDPIRQGGDMTWREFSNGINTRYCGSTLFKHGIGTERMERIAQFMQSMVLDNMTKAKIFWDEIISVKKLGIEEVYDATVPDLHNFVANDIILHNSIEQDADVVMFIYREDKDKRNTDKKNVAEIHIEKHRNGPTGRVELFFHEETATFRSIAKHFEEPL